MCKHVLVTVLLQPWRGRLLGSHLLLGLRACGSVAEAEQRGERGLVRVGARERLIDRSIEARRGGCGWYSHAAAARYVPSRKPFLARRGRSFRCRMRPVPVVLRRVALRPQLSATEEGERAIREQQLRQRQRDADRLAFATSPSRLRLRVCARCEASKQASKQEARLDTGTARGEGARVAHVHFRKRAAG